MTKDLQNLQNSQNNNLNTHNNGQDEVLATLLSFRDIKPRALWQEANKGRLLARIKQQEQKEKLEQKNAKFIQAKNPISNNKKSYFIKPMAWMAKPVAISLAIFGFASGAVLGTQAISPLSAFYPAKVFVANTYYKVLPKEKQIEYRLALANEKLSALKTLQDETNNQKIRQISYLTNSLTSDLYFASNSVKQITDIKKIVAISPQIKQVTQQLAKYEQPEIAKNTNTTDILPTTSIKAPTNKTDQTIDPKIQQLVKQTKETILAVITDSEDKWNNCPEYLNIKIENLSNSDQPTIFNPNKYPEIVMYLQDAKKAIQNNDCLKALELLDKVEKLKLQILINPSDSITK